MKREGSALAGFLVIGMFVLNCSSRGQIVLVASNELHITRPGEVVAVQAEELTSFFSNKELQEVRIVESKTGEEVPTQLIDYDQDGTIDEVLFQTSFSAAESRSFVVKKGNKSELQPFPSRVFGRYVPERKDDFAWENDRIAFRMYGPALQAEGEISSGIDVWVKNTHDLVINKWYKMDDYHTDHGEGLDCYKVGPSRGCGGIGIWEEDRLFVSQNYVDWKLIADGPIRVAFELSYAPWNVTNYRVQEVKRITLDAGSNLNKIESIFRCAQKAELTCAIGIVKRGEKGETRIDLPRGLLRYWQPADPINGTIGAGVIVEPGTKVRFEETKDHNFLLLHARTGAPLVYYSGACWSKSENFDTVEDWDRYLEIFSRRLQSPIVVRISPQ